MTSHLGLYNVQGLQVNMQLRLQKTLASTGIATTTVQVCSVLSCILSIQCTGIGLMKHQIHAKTWCRGSTPNTNIV